MEDANFAERRLKVSGTKILKIFLSLVFITNYQLFAQDIKEPNVAGAFYPGNPEELSQGVQRFLEKADPELVATDIFALISPHAGYEFSGQVAAYGYKLIKNKPYKTIVVIGPSHYYAFSGVSVFTHGVFRTPLGDIEIDKEFCAKLLYQEPQIYPALARKGGVYFEPRAFQREHSVEVQLPFLQKTLTDFKLVPIVMGSSSFSTCQKLARLLKAAIGERKDVLVIASSDMYHGDDYKEAEIIDNLTLSYLKNMDTDGLAVGLTEGKLQLCGGFPVLTTLILARESGHKNLKVLKYTNSAEVTGRKIKGVWTVGYTSCVIDQEKEKGEIEMLDKTQRKRLLEIARSSIETYLKSGRKLEVKEEDQLLKKEMGAFVTLHKYGQLRGCIGNMVGSQPLYLTVRDMAVEAAVDDPRFPPLQLNELENIEIELSVLSALRKVESADEIQLGVHGVIVKRGFHSGVFLPQVATETGWSKEEFLSNLCSHKAGLAADAWKDKSTELYVFTAEVFSEDDY